MTARERNGCSPQQSSLFDGLKNHKVVIVGEFGVGKTSLLWRHLHKEFCTDDRRATIVDIEKRRVTFGEKQIELSFWDTAGKEKYHTMSPNYYNGAHAIILVYDITNAESFDEISKYWINEILGMFRDVTDRHIPMLLVGTKLDLVDRSDSSQVTVSEADVKALKGDYEHIIGPIECSAKTGKNVEKVFQTLAREIFEQQMIKCNPLHAFGGGGENLRRTSKEQNNQDCFSMRKCS